MQPLDSTSIADLFAQMLPNLGKALYPLIKRLEEEKAENPKLWEDDEYVKKRCAEILGNASDPKIQEKYEDLIKEDIVFLNLKGEISNRRCSML
jgi:hypothetical protein